MTDKPYPTLTEAYDLLSEVIKKVPDYELQAELLGAINVMMEALNIPLTKISKMIDEANT